MSLAVQCPCGKVLNVPESRAGKELKCPACSETILIPELASSSGSSKQRTAESRVTQQRPTAPNAGSPARRREAPRPQQPAARPAPEMQNEQFAQDDLFGGFGGVSGGGLGSSGTRKKPTHHHRRNGIPNWLLATICGISAVAILLIVVSIATKPESTPSPAAAAPPAQSPPRAVQQVDPRPAPAVSGPGRPMPAFAGRMHDPNTVGQPK